MNAAAALKTIVNTLKADANTMAIKQTDTLQECADWLADHADIPAGDASELWLAIPLTKKLALASAALAFERFGAGNNLERFKMMVESRTPIVYKDWIN